MKPVVRPKLLMALVLLIVVAGFACIFYGKMSRRTVFLGKIDPDSGYRCRFTVSSTWERKDKVADRADGMLESVAFTSPGSSPIKRWLDQHLLHRSPSPRSTIRMWSANAEGSTESTEIQQGYPEPLALIDERILFHRRLRIDGYPATVVETQDSKHPLRWTALRVYMPSRSLFYEVQGSWEDPPSEESARELQRIIASFHIEQVAFPSGSRR